MSGLDAQRWSDVWQAAAQTVPPIEYIERLMAMFAEPHRHYHKLQHIADCLSEFDRARQLAADPTAVELAIWFHDAIYAPRARDNEERSAALAQDWLGKFRARHALVESVVRLVLATKNHDGALNPDAPLLVDVDLSILGQPPERFWEYERQIREEYSWVDQVVFAAKRAEILTGFLARGRIYQTDFFNSRLEARARANLQASIQRLRHQPAGGVE